MSKKMLIDASHLEEMRVVIMHNKHLEDFECETSTKKPMKGNIYLARVVRVEPSLQAAFVDFGSERHGFLAFNEIHPDYYRIPVEDQAKLLESLSAESQAEGEEPEDTDFEEAPKSRFKLKATRTYKIQEVIKKRQVILVQVVKDERGGKGAALTTYLSLPGRYCVLMPNTPRGGGISRKITDPEDRKRLKEMMGSFDVMEGAGLILRTAGMGRTKLEIKRDYDYLMRLWEEVREKTIQSQAPAPIYQEGNLITKAIRDLYTKEIEEVLVEGEEGYKEAKNLMRILIPSHAKKVQLYKDQRVPLFHRYDVEGKIDNIHHPVVQLPSGGYVVINPTEALVSIDVNSGRATRERHIEETALKTNLEAADEIARQLRLRDLAGLIVIDFIDMDHAKNNTLVERAFRDALKGDRARIQVGNISVFGLLEMSRQRLRASLAETISMPCHQCRGTGIVRSIESSSLRVLRAVESEGIEGKFRSIIVFLPTTVAFYLLNQKRDHLWGLEKKYDLSIVVSRDDTLIQPEFRIERVAGSERVVADNEVIVAAAPEETPQAVEISDTDGVADTSPEKESEKPSRSARRRQRRRRSEGRPEGRSESRSESRLEKRSEEEGVLTEQAPFQSPLTVSEPQDESDSQSPAAEARRASGDRDVADLQASPRRGRNRRPRRSGHPKENGPISSAISSPHAPEAVPSLVVSSVDEKVEEATVSRHGSTRLKVGPGSARHFGRQYAKLAKETIKRPINQDPADGLAAPLSLESVDVETEKSQASVLPVQEKPRKRPPVRRRAKGSLDQAAPPQEPPTINEGGGLPVVKERLLASSKNPKRLEVKDGDNLGTPSNTDNPHVQAARKKGWWKRLIDS